MKNLFLASAFVATLALSSGCSNDEVMGGDLVPSTDNAIIKVLDTVTVNVYTELCDTVLSSNSTYLLAGNLDDPIFGKTEASFAAKFSNTSYSKFAAGTVCDSVILTMGIDTTISRFYGDSLSAVTMNVYRLTDTLSIYTDYYNNYDITPIIENQPIGTATFVPNEADTMVTVHLDKSYGDYIIKAVTDTAFDERCGGLYFKVDCQNTMIKFKKDSKWTEMSVYSTDPDDNVLNTVEFSISTLSPRVSMLSHDYSGVLFEDQLKNPLSYQDTSLYLQSMVGTKLRVEFPYIGDLNVIGDNHKYWAISNATLIMPLADSCWTLENQYPAIDDYVCMARYNDTNTDFYPEDFLATYSSVSSLVIFKKDYSNHRYALNLTARINDLIKNTQKGDKPSYSLYIQPNGRITDFARSIINSPTHPKNPMKLVIEYFAYDE